MEANTVIRMEQREPARIVTPVRLSQAGRHHIAQRADEDSVCASEMHRRMLEYAAIHMPRGWTPNR